MCTVQKEAVNACEHNQRPTVRSHPPKQKVRSGNTCRQAREVTGPFLFPHSLNAAIFIFSNTVCVTMLAYYTAYLAPLALFPCRGVSRCTDKRTVCNRAFDWAS